MDKEKLKRENNALADQVSNLVDANPGLQAPKKGGMPNFLNFQQLAAGARAR